MLAFAPADTAVHEFAADGLDPVALQLGLRARVGDALDQWTIQVDAVEPVEPVEPGGSRRYELTLVSAGSPKPDHRTVELSGQTDADRSRELASILTLIIEAAADDPEPREAAEPREATQPSVATAPDRQPPTPRSGFIALEGHVGLGPPRDLAPELGVGLGAGAWLLNEHLQPRLRVRWAHGWAGEVRVHQLGAGLGLAAGTPVGDGRLWLGGLAMPAVKWTHAKQVRTATAWAGGGELSVLAQLRLAHVMVGVRTGVETTFPALRASGTQDALRWGHLRWLLVLEIGLVIRKKSELPR
ncbi:hypothetical protein DB30_07361 [Enhygromyxa salina]|uniref:Uncharacterized protein n=2 Tax=Enhygromyxa salina TaxID=215803 RepID=A0A0C2CWF1_9BACT|nr:hypothetical protein DB30_07361 [Enhygromyxa salina]